MGRRNQQTEKKTNQEHVLHGDSSTTRTSPQDSYKIASVSVTGSCCSSVSVVEDEHMYVSDDVERGRVAHVLSMFTTTRVKISAIRFDKKTF